MKALDDAFAKRVARRTIDLARGQARPARGALRHRLDQLRLRRVGAHGLVAFAPAYPLWSDDAGKLRYVRVPLGKSIEFDRKTQHFDIPDNTRFYKTFMKEVTDKTATSAGASWKRA